MTVDQPHLLAERFVILLEELNQTAKMTLTDLASMGRLLAGYTTTADGKVFPETLVAFVERNKARSKAIVDLAERLAVQAKSLGHDPSPFLAVADWERGSHPFSSLNSVLRATLHHDPPELRSRYYRRDTDYAAAHQLARSLAIPPTNRRLSASSEPSKSLPARGTMQVASNLKEALTREKILASPDADDESPDWGRWSMYKYEQERHRIPEIDEMLSRQEAAITEMIENHATAMRIVDPGYKPGDAISQQAVYAVLAHHFNMRPDEVASLPVKPTIYGMVKAFRLVTQSAATSRTTEGFHSSLKTNHSRVLTDADRAEREKQINAHIRQRLDRGAEFTDITLRSVFKATGISTGYISGQSNAWRALMAQRRQDKRPSPCKVQISPVDQLIAEQEADQQSEQHRHGSKKARKKRAHD